MADLVTLDEYKELESITSTKQDAKLELLIPWVSQLVKTYCGNSIVDHYTTPKVEEFNVEFETTLIQLSESPIVNITSVEERETYGSAYSTLTTGAFEYYVDTNTDCLVRTTSSGLKNWPTGPGAVRVTYTAGYASVPADLKLAVCDLITYYKENEHKPRQTLSGATRENQDTGQMYGFPDHIRRVLELYNIVW